VTFPIAGQHPSAALDQRRILAMGGGGFTMTEPSSALDRLVLELTGKSLPKICFLPTASGDQREQVMRFHERFRMTPCELSDLSLFHLSRDRVDPRSLLLSQDAIYVGGGSMRNMLAVWREHQIDTALTDAWEAGVVLAGLSAGAMCWFEGGITMSSGTPEPAAGLGLLSGSLSVHRSSEPSRLPAYLRAVADQRLPGGYAADDGTALLFAGHRLVECVASRPGRRIVQVKLVDGYAVQEPMSIRLLDAVPAQFAEGQRSARSAESDQLAIKELRSLRALDRGWT
jgi:dipeptidase E